MEELIKIMMMECALDYDNADHKEQTIEDIVNTTYDRYKDQLPTQQCNHRYGFIVPDGRGLMICSDCGDEI